MGLELQYEKGQTPLDEDEKQGLLIKSITNHGELDEFEQLNIEGAIEWLLNTKLDGKNVLTEKFIKTLHQKMLGQVWSWAGEFRKSDKNIGIAWYKIGTEIKILLDDVLFWMQHETYPPDEITIRFKHRLVSIHCFPNGNGRHSRIMADIIIESVFKREVFSWSSSHLVNASEARKQYLIALKAADRGNFALLLAFSRS